MDEYVVVEAPSGHRALFLGWLDSLQWSGEYSEEEWSGTDWPISRHYGPTPYLTILVRERLS
jgi:hypothetical protein